jgi:hypothetical protein
MIKVLIFSKDRAMQVDAALRSFFLHCFDHQSAQVNVLYKATNARHAAQYDVLSQEYPNVYFRMQKNFRRDMLDALSPFQAGTREALVYRLLSLLGFGFRADTRPDRILRRIVDVPRLKFTRAFFPRIALPNALLFLVDDNIFVRDFSLAPLLSTLSRNPDSIGFSLRLGKNTTWSYSANCPQPLPAFTSLSENMLKYRWVECGLDFGYPLEVSSSIYLDTVFLPFLLTHAFRNPNELESSIYVRAGAFRESHPSLLCFKGSVAFCNPVNIVQTFHPNRVGESQPYAIDELAARFDKGERIDVESYSGFTPNACHQEVELKFTRIK